MGLSNKRSLHEMTNFSSERVSRLDPPLGQLLVDDVDGMSDATLYSTIKRRHNFSETEILTSAQPIVWDESSLLKAALLRLEGYPVHVIADELSLYQQDPEKVLGNDDASQLCRKYVQEPVLEQARLNVEEACKNMFYHPPPGSMIRKWRDYICAQLKLPPENLFVDGKVPPAQNLLPQQNKSSLEEVLRVVYAAVHGTLSLEELSQKDSESLTIP